MQKWTLKKKLEELNAKIAYYEKIVHELSAPIIPSIVDDTILVPISGYFLQDRVETIQTRVLHYLGEHREINCTIFDFTGVEMNHIESLDYNTFALEISQLDAAMKLMGVRPIYVGFNPLLVREIVHAGIHVQIESYVNFKTDWLLYCIKRKNSSFIAMKFTLHITLTSMKKGALYENPIGHPRKIAI